LAATIRKFLNVGDVLKRLRLDARQNQIQFAKRLGISRSTYSNYENGNRVPDIETLTRISQILDIPFKTLIGVDEVSLFREIEDFRLYDITKEKFLKQMKEDNYSFEYVSKMIGYKVDDIKQFLIDPYADNEELFMALGRFLMFTETELAKRIEFDRKYLKEAHPNLIKRYKVSSELYIDEISELSKQDTNNNEKLDPEVIKQARELFNSIYQNSKHIKFDEGFDIEGMLLEKFRLLNDLGQQEGIKRIDELSQIDKYKKKDEDPAINENKPDNQE